MDNLAVGDQVLVSKSCFNRLYFHFATPISGLAKIHRMYPESGSLEIEFLSHPGFYYNVNPKDLEKVGASTIH